jgi:predicted DNA-binding transcriptional regulator YafY
LRQSKARAVRLLQLAAAIANGATSLKDLRELHGLYPQAKESTGRQQFERDKADLLEAGLKIRTTAEHDYVIEPFLQPPFTEPELDALYALTGVVADPASGAALAAFAAGADAYPDVEAGARVLSTIPDALLPAAQEIAHAVSQRRVVTFAYGGANAAPSVRRVEPWTLRSRRGFWYLLGHDLDRDAHRFFRMDRMHTVPVREHTVCVADVPDPMPTDLLPGAAGRVTMLLTSRGRFDARRLGAWITEQRPSGTDAAAGPAPSVATFAAIRDEAAVGFALRFDAIILDPPALDDERRQRADRVHDVHSLQASPQPDGVLASTEERLPLPPARIRRLLLLPGWLSNRPGIGLDEAARGLGCTPAELRDEIELLGSVTLPGVGEVFDLGVDEDSTITGHSVMQLALHLSPLERSRVRTLVDAARTLRPDAVPSVGLTAIEQRLDDAVIAAVDPDVAPGLLRQIREAVDGRRVVSFRYRRRAGDEASIEDRRLTPTSVVYVEGHTYVVGYDHDRAAGRSFRLDRLAMLELGDADPVRRTVDTAPPRYVPTGPETVVVLRCTHVGSWVLHRLLPAARGQDGDGLTWALVRTDQPSLVLDHVMVAGGEVEVVSPDELRRDIAERAGRVR